MLKFCLIIITLLLLNSCGVNTSSSSSRNSKSLNQTGSTNGSNTNNSGSDNNDTNSSGSTTSTSSLDDALFDTVDAEFDANACDGSTYKFASDASFGGSEEGANGSSLFFVADQGLWIGSEHLEADAQSRNKTWVILYYKSFPDSTLLNTQGSTSYIKEGIFVLSYDIAWTDASIPNVDNTVYVLSANYDSDKGEKPSCYRAKLSSVSGSSLSVSKVYR